MDFTALNRINNSDYIGIASSTFCMIHCAITPLLFLAKGSTLGIDHSSPLWWTFIDYFFLIISFIAVYRSSRTRSKSWIGRALRISWFILSIVILNEKIEIISLPEYAIYFPSIALIILHLYSQKNCQFGSECVH